PGPPGQEVPKEVQGPGGNPLGTERRRAARLVSRGGDQGVLEEDGKAVAGGRMDEMLFPEAALAILRQARWDPNATHSFEVVSGGFAWSDERLQEAAAACMEHRSWAFRYLMGYRASLTRGAPREELRPPWDQLLRECPEWPGFRSERSGPEVAAEL